MHQYCICVSMRKYTGIVSSVSRGQFAQTKMTISAPSPRKSLSAHWDSTPPGVHVQGAKPVKPPYRRPGSFAPNRASQWKGWLGFVILLAQGTTCFVYYCHLRSCNCKTLYGGQIKIMIISNYSIRLLWEWNCNFFVQTPCVKAFKPHINFTFNPHTFLI